MNEGSMDSEDEKEGETPTGGGARRGKRTSKRSVSRPPSLRRKAPARKEEKEGPGKPAANPESAGEPREKPAGRPARRRVAAKKKTPAAMKKKATTPAKPRRQQTRAVKRDEEEYELRPQPDGTLYRVKISEKKKPVRKAPPRRRGDTGPGPAVVDLGVVKAGKAEKERKITLGSITRQTRRSASFLKTHLGVKPEVAVVLGSGLSSVADLVSDEPVGFSEIPGFQQPVVPGHPGRVRAGSVEGVPTLFCEGRLHFYETGSMAEVVYPVQTFMALGVQRLILTTSAGAVSPSLRVGDIMFVKDHINLMGDNPMFGLDPGSSPSVFVDTSSIYDERIIHGSERLCRRSRISCHSGILAGVRGPVYETHAERAWLESMGVDAVCMSVVPEALAAAHVGVPVVGLALITNDASSKGKPLSHESVAKEGRLHAGGLKRLVTSIIAQEW